MLAHTYGDGWLFVVRFRDGVTAYAQGAVHLTVRSRCCLHTTLPPVFFAMLLLLGNMNRHAASVRSVILQAMVVQAAAKRMHVKMYRVVLPSVLVQELDTW